jgi:hypothetical protein
MNQAQASARAGAVIAVAIAALGVAALAGCSSAAQTTSSAATTTNTGASPASATSATTGPTTGPTTPPTSPPAAAVPTLGQLTGDFAHGQGFGQVKPSKIFNGGDPTGLVTHVTWSSWGGSQAQGTGTSEYVGPNQSVATGTEESATVVAFNLGTCDGRLMYQAVEWYFPQHGQAFDPNHYENICTGTFVPSQ